MRTKLQLWLKRFLVRILRNALWRADEWVHAQEVLLRDEAAEPALLAEVNRSASAARERARRRERPGGGVLGARAACRASRNGLPRLKYQRGEFVRG